MISNWITDVLTVAYEFFNEKIKMLFDLLMIDPKTYMDGNIWEVAESIFSLLLASGYTIMTLCIYIELIHSGYESIVQRKPETIVWIFLATSVMGGIMSASQDFLLLIFRIGQGFVGKIIGASGSSMITFMWELPDIIINATNGLSTVMSLVIFILCLLGACVVLFSSFTILMIGYGRVFNIFFHLSVAPIPVAFLGSAITRQYFFNYLKSFLVITMQGLAIVVACVIFAAFSKGYVRNSISQKDVAQEEITDEKHIEEELQNGVSSATGNIFSDDKSESPVTVVTSYLIEQAFLFLLLTGIIKKSDAAVGKYFGIG